MFFHFCILNSIKCAVVMINQTSILSNRQVKTFSNNQTNEINLRVRFYIDRGELKIWQS